MGGGFFFAFYMKNTQILLAVGLGVLLLRKRPAVGAIYPAVPELYPCNDGTFTTSPGSRGCARHGGKKSNVPVSAGGGSSLLNIMDVPLGDIQTDTTLFQGREKKFSERSVDNIVNDALSGAFVWENLDPVTLWRSPEGVLYLLSGHSRKEAFRRLAQQNVTVQGKTFDRIPAKIIVGMPLAAAQRLALESNTLSTKETDIERAAYYRRLRQEGTQEAALLAQIKKNEGRNWTNIYAYTFLNPDGKTWATLRQFNNSEDTSATLAKSLAKWIGQSRKQFSQLTNMHENELFDWLFTQKGYGTGAGKVSNEREYLEKVQYFVAKNTFMGQFNPEAPLNIQNTLYKSPAEAELDTQVTELQGLINSMEREIKTDTVSLTQRGASRTDLARILAPKEAALRNYRSALAKLIQKRADIVKYSQNEVRLFGIGKIYDDVKIKPGSRVDRYWQGLTVELKKVGVEAYKEKYYRDASAAIEHFNLYSIEFGNWMNQQDRINFMYGSLVTLRDMATVLGVSHQRMGIHGKLSLALGARGMGGRAAAFYQPGVAVINLTKPAGKGSLIHEYGHAVDYLNGVLSDGRSRRKGELFSIEKTGTMKYHMELAIDKVLWYKGKPSSYADWLSRESEYFNRRNEIWARMCEGYFWAEFRKRGIKNTWGVDAARGRDWPEPKLIEAAAPHIKKVFLMGL